MNLQAQHKQQQVSKSLEYISLSLVTIQSDVLTLEEIMRMLDKSSAALDNPIEFKRVLEEIKIAMQSIENASLAIDVLEGTEK